MLLDTGMRAQTETGCNARALDDDELTVVVMASHEVIQDHEWPAIFDVASVKYAKGDVVPNSEPPMVRVTTADFDGA